MASTYSQRREAGLCANCGAPASRRPVNRNRPAYDARTKLGKDGRKHSVAYWATETYCAPCRDKALVRQKRVRAKRRCEFCRTVLDGTRRRTACVTCVPPGLTRAERYRLTYRLRRARQACGHCGALLPTDLRSKCRRCLDREKQRHRAQAADRKDHPR